MAKYRKYHSDIKEMIIETRNPNLFPELNIPRTTAIYWIEPAAKKRKKTNLKIKSHWFFYTDHISKTQKSICKGVGELSEFSAYSIDSKRALLFVKSSGRPGHDLVTSILIDTNLGKVLDQKELGASRNNYIAVLKTKRGFKTRIIRDSLSFHEQVSCDCDAPFVDDWMQIEIKNNKIVPDWIKK